MPAPLDEARRDAFAERIVGGTISMLEMFSVYLGDRLGLYAALRDGEPATPAELAARAGTHERYTREWLEQQAVAGIIDVSAPVADAAARRFSLDPAHAEVLADHESLNYLAPLPRLASSAGQVLDALAAAYRSGGGVPWSLYGADAREGQAAVNRPAFLKLLGAEWLPSIPDLHRRLGAQPPARVADLGCGEGWSCIGMARAYPTIQVDGFDFDEPSVERARAHALAAGLSDRVHFETRDAASGEFSGRYELVTLLEALHDMARPVEALRAARGMLAAGGSVLVMDERVAEQFVAPGDDVERMMYGWSVLFCLANGMTEQPSAATGTVMRPDTLRAYATDAGFSSVEVLPIENDFFRFYQLRP